MRKKIHMFMLLASPLALSAPGTALATPTPDTTSPTITLFTVPATSSSLRVPITALAATDDVVVTGYFLTSSPTPPLAGAKGWFPTPPPNFNYTFLPDPSHSNVKTIYAWAKDAAGNISLAKTASVTINQTDTARPVVTSFTVAQTATPRTAKITAFTATDNVEVTGYRVTRSATAPLAGASGWWGRPRILNSTVTFATAGEHKLYAWTKDAAGNVSLAKVARVWTPRSPIALARAKSAPDAAALLPLPPAAGTLEFAYDPTESPVLGTDPASAMPIGIGPAASGGNTVSLETGLTRFAGPVDVYLTLYFSSMEGSAQAYGINPSSNEFEPITGTAGPWRSGVIELKERVWDAPVEELASGTYTLSLEVTPAGQSDDSRYRWTTSFTIQ